MKTFITFLLSVSKLLPLYVIIIANSMEFVKTLGNKRQNVRNNFTKYNKNGYYRF